jgi:hypothetical protein
VKTTVEIADPLLEEAKQLAHQQGTTLRVLFEEGLRVAIEARKSTERKPFRLRDGSFKGGKGLVDPSLTWEQIRDLSYGKRGGHGDGE